VLSATLAGLAGSLKALVFQLASLNDVRWNMSGEVVLMTLLGGMGTVFGPVVGAVVIEGDFADVPQIAAAWLCPMRHDEAFKALALVAGPDDSAGLSASAAHATKASPIFILADLPGSHVCFDLFT